MWVTIGKVLTSAGPDREPVSGIQVKPSRMVKMGVTIGKVLTSAGPEREPISRKFCVSRE